MNRSLESDFLLLISNEGVPLTPKRDLTATLCRSLVASTVSEYGYRYITVTEHIVEHAQEVSLCGVSSLEAEKLALRNRRAREGGSPGDPVIRENATWAHSRSDYVYWEDFPRTFPAKE